MTGASVIALALHCSIATALLDLSALRPAASAVPAGKTKAATDNDAMSSVERVFAMRTFSSKDSDLTAPPGRTNTRW
jgi:hypothetical protein